MFERLYQNQWMSLPREIRLWLRAMFDIPQTNVVEVRDNTVLTDGVTNDDLKAITLEKLKEFTKQEGTFAQLFEIVTQKLQFELAVQNGSITKLEEVKDLSTQPVKYCDTCDSKKGRHKKVCPKYS